MAKDATFTSILDAPASAAERPPALPAGTYIAVVKGLPNRGKSTKKQTDYIEYTLSILGSYTNSDGECDVDADDLAAFGDVKGKEMKLTYYMTEKSAFRHKEFLMDDLRLEFDDDASHWGVAQQTAGSQFLVTIRQKPTDDGKGVYSEIASTAPMGG